MQYGKNYDTYGFHLASLFLLIFCLLNYKIVFVFLIIIYLKKKKLFYSFFFFFFIHFRVSSFVDVECTNRCQARTRRPVAIPLTDLPIQLSKYQELPGSRYSYKMIGLMLLLAYSERAATGLNMIMSHPLLARQKY